MDENTAKAILLGGVAVGLMVWLLAVSHLIRMRRQSPLIRKQTTVPNVSKRQAMVTLLRLLTEPAQTTPYTLTHGPSRITARSTDSVTFESHKCTTTVELRDFGSGVIVETEFDCSRIQHTYTRLVSLFVLTFIPAAIYGAIYVIWRYVIPNPNPGVRWQVMQVCQIVHVLWPPFMFSYQYKQARSIAEAFVDNLPTRIEVGGENAASQA